MKAHSTSDVPLDLLRELRDELAPAIELEVGDRQTFFRSAEPPSWVAFLAESEWWVKVLGAYAALYVAEIVKEAAKDTWKARGKAIAAAKVATRGIANLAAKLASLRERLAFRTRIHVGLPFPDEHFATRLEIAGSDAHEIAVQIALFVHYLPALNRLIESERLSDETVATGILLRLLPDASLEVSWSDARSLSPIRRLLSITYAA